MEPSSHPDPAATAATVVATRQPGDLNVLMIDVEPVHADLIALWLAGEGWLLRPHAEGEGPVHLIVVEIAFPRRGDRERIDALAAVWPGARVVVLSATFRGELPPHGEVARELGAAAVLATPLTRERLLAAMRDVLGPAP